MSDPRIGCPSCDRFVDEKQPPCPYACMSDKCKEKRRPVINVNHKPVVWVLGGPGCGKGTQCALISENYGFTHLSTGDLLRAEVSSGSERAHCLEGIMASGGLVPNDIVLNLLREEMKKLDPTSKGFIIDGYPRERHQGKAFEKAVSPVTVSPETLLRRLKGRAATAAVLRADDTEEIFKKRIDTFLHNNQLIINQYKHKLHEINAEATVEEIYALVQEVMNPIVTQANIAFEAHSAAIKAYAAAKVVKAAAAAAAAALKIPKSVHIAAPLRTISDEKLTSEARPADSESEKKKNETKKNETDN